MARTSRVGDSDVERRRSERKLNQRLGTRSAPIGNPFADAMDEAQFDDLFGFNKARNAQNRRRRKAAQRRKATRQRDAQRKRLRTKDPRGQPKRER